MGVVVRVRVLGPLEVSNGQALRRLGPAKQRALLAALVVRAGHPVSVDRLVEELWEKRRPASAVNLVQGYVAGLRRAIGDASGELLRTQPPGYQLALPPEELDIGRFEALVDRGRKSFAEGDARAAAQLLAEAQRLWRGQPFADVPPTDAVEAEAGRLEQLRLAALETRIDADLDLGRHSELLPELRTLTGSHPMVERFWGQLMLALYRSGRQAEALSAYQRLYALLTDQLGVVPTRPVRDLHQRILTGDPALDIAPPKPARAARIDGTPVPRQLPAGIRDFTGRTEQLAALDALLPGDDDRLPPAVLISAIGGTAGVGKTALAVRWAHRVADRFPDGQLYVNLRGFDPSGSVLDPAEAVRALLGALGVAPQRVPAGLPAQAGLYRSLLAGRRMLVLLDNARDAEQVRPLLPGAPGCLVVVTSRNQLASLVAVEGAHLVTLGLLTPAEAGGLLAARLGPDRMAAEPEAVEEIIAACARLPLALAVVAARAAAHPGFPLAALAGELREARGRLDALVGGDPVTDVRAVFSWSYRTLSPAAARLFCLLGLHPGPDIAAPAAASLAGLPPAQVRPPLAELTRAHLVIEHTPGRYALHDLLRAYAEERARADEPDDRRRAATHRMLDHYLRTAAAAARLLTPTRDPITLAPPKRGVTPQRLADRGHALAWFTTEHAVLLAALDRATDSGMDSHAWQLAWALADYLSGQGHWHDLAAAGRAAVTSADRLADPAAQASAHRGVAVAAGWLGRFEDARSHLRQAQDLYRRAGDRAGQAYTHLILARVMNAQGDHVEDLDHARRALGLFRAAGHRVGQANALNAVGAYHGHIGDHDQALNYCQHALTLLEEVGDREGQASAWSGLGYANHRLGNHARAITCYRNGLHLQRDLGNRYLEALTLDRLGDAQHAAGNPADAAAAWRQAAAILEDLDLRTADLVRAKLTPTPTRAGPGGPDGPGGSASPAS